MDNTNIHHLETMGRLVISVVVCTYNRAELLARALQALCDQALDTSAFEIIVVDNNSRDQTRTIVEDLSGSHRNVRYLFELQQGLSHARNRGWREAQGEYVAYTDDDCKVPKHWLKVAKEIIDQVSPRVFGGPYFAFYNTPKPRWFKDAYGSNDLGDQARFLTQNEYLSGGNIFFRRTLLQDLGGFDPELGMSGRKIAYGEETDLIVRIRSMTKDPQIYYDPRLYAFHLVRGEKMRLGWIMRQRLTAGRYFYQVFEGNLPTELSLLSLFGKAASRILLLGADLLYGTLFRDRTHYPYIQNYICEHTSRYIRALGLYYEQARLLRDQRLKQ